MAKISLDLSQFKAAGVYTIEQDNSQRVVVTTQSLRLVPGFSATGPFNTPVFLNSSKERATVYGEIDEKLERKGSFFHRMLDTCLTNSPVFAINLLNVNQNPSTEDNPNTDVVDYTGYSLNSAAHNLNYDPSANDNKGGYVNYSGLFSSFFDKTRFWEASTDNLQAQITLSKTGPVSQSTIMNSNIFNIVNVGTQTVTVFVRKAQSISGFNVFARDWYGSESNIPYEWIRPYDYIKDYFIEIYAISGDWTNYNDLAIDPYWSSYFNSDGIKKDRLTQFVNLPQINSLGSWVGTIIPDFVDGNGANQFIESIVNSNVQLTGIMININQDALDNLTYDAETKEWSSEYQIDLVGHNLINEGFGDDVSDPADDTAINLDFLSYVSSVPNANIHTVIDNIIPLNPTIGLGKQFLVFEKEGYDNITIGTFVEQASTEILGVTPVTNKQWIAVDSPSYTTNSYSLTQMANENYFVQNSAFSELFEQKEGTWAVKEGITGAYLITTATPFAGYDKTETDNIRTQKPIDDVVSSYKGIAFKGLAITNKHLPGYSETGQPNAEEGVNKIYSMLMDEGILRGLTNKDMIQYRYIVDTMAYGLRPEMGGKHYLSLLAKKRGKTTAILNAPSMTQFANSQDPYFCDTFNSATEAKPIFNTKWIPEGGNPNMQRSFQFTLPSEENGSKYCGVFGPFLKYQGTNKTILVPPAADVSNTYLLKFQGGSPYAIVANQNGLLTNASIVGIEYALDLTDREYLEPFGYNSIIKSNSQYMIYANCTSYQTLKSDFNYLHVRELLNTMELEIDDILAKYVFDYNTSTTRLNIVNNVEPILQTMQDAGAIVKYEITMDTTNNTEAIIDESFGILDIGVWINKGMQKIINRITVNKLSSENNGGSTYV